MSLFERRAMTTIFQSHLPDSGAVVQIHSARPLSLWDAEHLIHSLQLLRMQAERRENAEPIRTVWGRVEREPTS